MGGFLYNGCGASDSYNKVKSLGQGYCKNCKKTATFGLYELARKVRIVWIPTVTLSTKCAVICDKCKCGSYVEGDLLTEILADRAVFEFGADGIKITTQKEDLAPAINGQTQIQPDEAKPQPAANLPAVAQKTENQPSAFQAAGDQAAATQIAENQLAAKRAAPSFSEVQFVRRKKVCPSCKMSYSSQKTTCDICGIPLKEG